MSCLGKQRRQDSFISTTAASDTTRKLHNTMKGQKKKGHGKAKTGVYDPWCWNACPHMNEGWISMTMAPRPFSPAPKSSSIEARQWCPGEEEVTSYLPFIAMSDRRSEMSTLATKESCKQNDTGKEVHDDSICLAKKGTQELFLSHLCRWKLGDKLLRYLQMVHANSTMCVGREEPSTGKAGPAHVRVFSSCSSTSQQH